MAEVAASEAPNTYTPLHNNYLFYQASPDEPRFACRAEPNSKAAGMDVGCKWPACLSDPKVGGTHLLTYLLANYCSISST